jgi:hypothetical protein
MPMKRIIVLVLLQGVFGASAWAETVRNNTTTPVAFEAAGGKWVILPRESAELDSAVFSHPVVQRLISSGRLVHETKLTEEACNSGDFDDYCFLDLAEQEKSAVYCAYYDFWSSVRECLYYVNRQVKLTTEDCLVFDPGSNNRNQCITYVESGIPSVPGQSYEQSLRNE